MYCVEVWSTDRHDGQTTSHSRDDSSGGAPSKYRATYTVYTLIVLDRRDLVDQSVYVMEWTDYVCGEVEADEEDVDGDGGPDQLLRVQPLTTETTPDNTS